MSDTIHERFGDLGFGQGDLDTLAPYVGSISPDFDSSKLYAPVNYTPGTSPLQSVDPNKYYGKDAAQRLSADVIRAQYRDYQTRFQPLEDMAIGLLTPNGTKDLPGEMARTATTIDSSFQSLQGQQDRSRQRFGLQGVGNDITGGMAKTSAMVGGLNNTKMADEDRRLKLLGGGSSAIAEAARGGG